MKTYVFKVELESDEEGWRAFYSPWENMGASTWGKTKEEAIKNIQEVLEMIVEEFIEEGKAIPEEPKDEVQVFSEPRVAVSI